MPTHFELTPTIELDRLFEPSGELYNHLFAVLQSYFLTLFPSGATADDHYVWQFLAALAVGALPEQQHILVSEVR